MIGETIFQAILLSAVETFDNDLITTRLTHIAFQQMVANSCFAILRVESLE
jgi:hypothetical protein